MDIVYVSVSVGKNTMLRVLIVADRIMSSPPKMSIKSTQPVHMLLHSKAELRLGWREGCCISWPWDKDMILEYSEGSNVITEALRSGREKLRRSEWCHVRRAHTALAGLEDGGRTHEPMNTGNLYRSKKRDSSLEPLERNAVLPTPWF